MLDAPTATPSSSRALPSLGVLLALMGLGCGGAADSPNASPAPRPCQAETDAARRAEAAASAAAAQARRLVHQLPLLPRLDPLCAAMAAEPGDMPLEPGFEGAYFEQPIPRLVHQIWLGDPARLDEAGPDSWREMAAQFGYVHRLWREADLPEIEAGMPQRNVDLLRRLLGAGDYPAASDLLRIAILRVHGGIYADVDIAAPRVQGRPIDLAAVVPLRNIVLMTEHTGRNTGSNVALFVANGLMMAAAGHPLIQHLSDAVADNASAQLAAAEHGGAAYLTGPFFISRSLAGALTVLPITYLERLGMVH